MVGTNGCASVDVSSSYFVFCSCGTSGGGSSTHIGPSCSISSSCFVFCTANWGGGGVYHNSGSPSSSLTISDSLFTQNIAYARDRNDRGGGGFEDWRDSTYFSKCSFSFFSDNSAPNCVGYDICSHERDFGLENIVQCFTTTTLNSFYNHGSHVENWLALTNIPVDLDSYSSIHKLFTLHNKK